MSEALKRALKIALAQPEPSEELIALLEELIAVTADHESRITALENP